MRVGACWRCGRVVAARTWADLFCQPTCPPAAAALVRDRLADLEALAGRLEGEGD